MKISKLLMTVYTAIALGMSVYPGMVSAFQAHSFEGPHGRSAQVAHVGNAYVGRSGHGAFVARPAAAEQWHGGGPRGVEAAHVGNAYVARGKNAAVVARPQANSAIVRTNGNGVYAVHHVPVENQASVNHYNTNQGATVYHTNGATVYRTPTTTTVYHNDNLYQYQNQYPVQTGYQYQYQQYPAQYSNYYAYPTSYYSGYSGNAGTGILSLLTGVLVGAVEQSQGYTPQSAYYPSQYQYPQTYGYQQQPAVPYLSPYIVPGL